MLIYFLIFIFFMLFAFLERGSKRSRIFFVSYSILLVLFVLSSGLRDLIGGYDVYIYRAGFLSSDVLRNSYSFEIGFNYLLVFFKWISNSEFFMFFGISCIIGFSHFSIFKKYCSFFFVAIFIYFCKFYLMSYVYLRQGIAMGIVWYSLNYILKRDLIRYMGLLVVSFLFHKSALIFFPMYFLTKRYRKIIYIGAFFVLFVLILSPFLDTIFSFIASFNERYQNYGANLNTKGNLLYVVEAFVCFVVFILSYGKSEEEKNETTLYDRIVLNGFFIYILLLLVAYKQDVFIRMTWYYLIFYCIVLSNYVYRSNFHYRVFKPILIIVFTALFFRMLLVWDNGDFIPYKSIFDSTIRNSMWRHLK